MADIECKVGDLVEILEGSWFGLKGTIERLVGDTRMDVRTPDGGLLEGVVACTTARLNCEMCTNPATQFIPTFADYVPICNRCVNR